MLLTSADPDQTLPFFHLCQEPFQRFSLSCIDPDQTMKKKKMADPSLPLSDARIIDYLTATRPYFKQIPLLKQLIIMEYPRILMTHVKTCVDV